MKHTGSVLEGTLLIAGTSIGAGMLAMPVITSLGGFTPSICIYLLCWAVMSATGLLFVELCNWMDKDANIISMARLTLGRSGEIFAWLLYIFLFYSLILAYLVGCGDLISQLFHESISEWAGALFCALLIAPLLYIGPRAISPINMIFLVGLGLSFFAFIALGYQYVDTSLLTYKNWPLSLMGLPIAFIAFTYQGTVPTVFNFLGRNVTRTRSAVLLGTFIAFLTYSIWQWLILGIVPVFGPEGLDQALHEGSNAVKPLRYFIQNPAVFWIGEIFAFCALITSFFGVALGLIDFLSDGCNIQKTPGGKIILCLALFIPPLAIAYFIPHLFLDALNYAGGIGCALLLVFLPAIMIWSGRYRMGHSAAQVLPGGRVVLVLLVVFVVLEIAAELLPHYFNKSF